MKGNYGADHMKTSKMLSFNCFSRTTQIEYVTYGDLYNNFTVVKKLKKGDLKNYSRAKKVFQFIIQWISA